MKVGDKVVCIKTYSCGNKLMYEKGKQYKIISIYVDEIPEITVIYEGSEHYSKSVSFTKRFNNYFIGIKEQRKLKLEKINENRNT